MRKSRTYGSVRGHRANGGPTVTLYPPSQFGIDISLMSRGITRMEGGAGKQ